MTKDEFRKSLISLLTITKNVHDFSNGVLGHNTLVNLAGYRNKAMELGMRDIADYLNKAINAKDGISQEIILFSGIDSKSGISDVDVNPLFSYLKDKYRISGGDPDEVESTVVQKINDRMKQEEEEEKAAEEELMDDEEDIDLSDLDLSAGEKDQENEDESEEVEVDSEDVDLIDKEKNDDSGGEDGEEDLLASLGISLDSEEGEEQEESDENDDDRVAKESDDDNSEPGMERMEKITLNDSRNIDLFEEFMNGFYK